jgi:hypothetical protein
MENIYKKKYYKYKEKYTKLKKKLHKKSIKNNKLSNSFDNLKFENSIGNLEKLHISPTIYSQRPISPTIYSQRPLLSPVSPIILLPLLRPRIIETIPYNRTTTPKIESPKKYQIIYGVFNKELAEKLNLIKSKLAIPSNYIIKYTKTISDAYTPFFNESENIIKNDNELDEFKKFLPTINKIDDLILVGANAFFREDKIIIKVSFSSEIMNNIRNKLFSGVASLQKYKELYIKQLSEKIPLIRSKYSSSKYYEDDNTFNDSKLDWIYYTIEIINSIPNINNIDTILDNANKVLLGLGLYKTEKYSINQIKFNDNLLWSPK